MKIMMLAKYPPIQGGVTADAYWTAQILTEMGHEVQVVTNSAEVENDYRVTLTDKDQVLLKGYRSKDSIVVHQTYLDKRHVHIPQTNPMVSKLVGIGLSVVESFKPDLIWAYYIEPYGVAALLISKLTGVPFSIRHAGSDLGRLMKTDQLESLYREVFRNALVVLSRAKHFPYFESIGVKTERLWSAVSPRLPSDVFFHEDFRKNRDKLVVGIYGKVGPAKGTDELLQALAILKSQGIPCVLKAHWGGRLMKDTWKRINELSLEDMVEITGFIPHWEIPAFICDCDMIIFLENRFSITFHGPAIPLESLACGRPLVVTEEIKNKPSFTGILSENENCLVVPSPPTPESVAEAIKEMGRKIRADCFKNQSWFNAKERDLRVRQEMEDLLEIIRESISQT